MPKIECHQHPSPNWNERDPSVGLSYILLHYTGMKSRDEAIARLCDAKAQVSAHYVIDEDGVLFQLVDETKRAWHAGQSFWRGITDMNSASIGIELVNPGHEFGYRPFPAKQIEALTPLLFEIIERHHLSKQYALLAHADVAPARREDPGELFPWESLADKGLGFWPRPRPDDYVPISIDRAQLLLRLIGFDCPETGILDEATTKVVRAFQRHYCPESLFQSAPDLFDIETCARLRALSREKPLT